MVRRVAMIRVDVVLLVTSARAVGQSIDSNGVPRIRGGKSSIYDTSDELISGSTRAHSSHINPQHSRIRGRNFVVFDTSKDSTIEPLPEMQLEATASLLEADTNNYDFGRFVLHRKRLDGSATSERNKIDGKNAPHQRTRRSKEKNTRKETNLDVDVEYLESFLRSRQKKREKHQIHRNTQAASTERHVEEKMEPELVVHEEISRFLDSSNDLSYIYTSIPTPSPDVFSVPTLSPTPGNSEVNTTTEPTAGEVPTLTPSSATPEPSASLSSKTPSTIPISTTGPTSLSTITTTSAGPTISLSTSPPSQIEVITFKPSVLPESVPTASPSYTDIESEPTASPSFIEIESEPTASPTYTDIESEPTASPSFIDIESVPTASPSYTDIESVPTASPTYTDVESIPTASPTFITIESETNMPTYLSLESVPTLSPTFLTTVNVLTISNPCPDDLDKKETLLDDLTLKYDIIVVDDENRQVFCTELKFDGEGWLGLGISEKGEMIGSTAVIGIPGTNDAPGLYSLDGKTNSLVKVLPEQDQTLLDASIIQENGTTLLRFAKYIDDGNEDFVVNVPGVTNFIYAAADSNEFGYHGMRRGSLSLVLSNAKSWKKAKRQSRDKESTESKKQNDR